MYKGLISFMSVVAIAFSHNANATTTFGNCILPGKPGDYWQCTDTCCATTKENCFIECPITVDPGGPDNPPVMIPYSVRDGGNQSDYTCQTKTYTYDDGSPYCTSSITLFSSASNCAEEDYFCYSSIGPNNTTYRGRVKYCKTCPSGYKKETTSRSNQYDCLIKYPTCVKEAPCAGLACEGATFEKPRTDSTNAGRIMWCNENRNSCEYSCKDNYYNAAVIPGTSAGGVSCKPCPENAQCFGGGLCCNQGYYVTRVRLGTTINATYTYSCHRCPSLGNVTGTTTSLTCPVLDEGKNSAITFCYIPKDTAVTIESGTFTFTEDCYYTSTGDFVVGPVVTPGQGGGTITPAD